jgi:cell division protein FtsB
LAAASPYAFRRPVDNAFLVRQRDRRRRRELLLVVAVLVPLGLGLLSYTWVHQEVLSTGYRIDGLERRLDELNRRERELLLEAAYLASPGRIEERASAELGMAPPALSATVFWEELP